MELAGPCSRSWRSTAALVLDVAQALQKLGRLAEGGGNLDAERPPVAALGSPIALAAVTSTRWHDGAHEELALEPHGVTRSAADRGSGGAGGPASPAGRRS